MLFAPPHLEVGGCDILRDGLREEVHLVLCRQHLQQPAQRLGAAPRAEEFPDGVVGVVEIVEM